MNRLLYLILFLLLSGNVNALTRESEHFIYYFEAADSSIIDDLTLKLESNYVKITTDLRLTLHSKVKVHIYPTLQEFHNAIGWPGAPDWLVGMGGTEIYVVSPLNPGPQHTYDEMVNNVILHEFVHICTNEINFNPVSWITEGYALYTVGPYSSHASIVSALNRLGRIPTLDELEYNFVDLSGYQIAPTIFDFAFEKFGKESVINFIYNTTNFSVFGGLTKSEFQQQWMDYVVKTYPAFTGVKTDVELNEFTLFQNYPNPFNPTTKIEFQIPKTSDKSKTTLKIYDCLGNEISTLINEERPAGKYSINWNADNLSSGTYFYQLKYGKTTITKKLLLIK